VGRTGQRAAANSGAYPLERSRWITATWFCYLRQPSASGFLIIRVFAVREEPSPRTPAKAAAFIMSVKKNQGSEAPVNWFPHAPSGLTI
jgi:hypothetical protein